MVETSIDRQDGDLFWKKKNLLTLAVEVNWASNKAERLRKRGGVSREKALSMIPPKRRARSSAPDEAAGKALVRALEKEVGPIPSDMIMAELPGFKMPEPFTLSYSEKRLDGLTECSFTYLWLVDFVEEHGRLFSSQTLGTLFFNNEGLSEFRERAFALRESICRLLEERCFLHLNEAEISDLLSIWIKSEVFARVSGNALDFIAWAADKTKTVVASNAAEDFREMDSLKLYRVVSEQLTPIFNKYIEGHKPISETSDNETDI